MTIHIAVIINSIQVDMRVDSRSACMIVKAIMTIYSVPAGMSASIGVSSQCTGIGVVVLICVPIGCPIVMGACCRCTGMD